MNEDENDITFEETEEKIEEKAEEEILPDNEDLAIEEKMKLTGEEEKWQEKLSHEIKNWKANASNYAPEIQKYIRDLKSEDLSPEDTGLFHVFSQAQEYPTPYFRQKFNKLVRKQIRESHGDYESAAYQLAKILESLSQPEE
ncbi:MAG: hypothetical protein COT26_01365 [Candidatus Kerfeldbacteria bacterium CG08_land_8_20_14_0_20_43_14]|uniref:Uncharacterized protein n=1 Tax=Candidatus Kerfeldbacteria bacterium CG08_land_8_20_14_0_20_43_14 TaxID=2014246 RepID=A0A2H0YQM2_9BACT|nr:MAG: hypothetical protein COT26_01365 [Candidatus Kerfeldbacteria bacterium CG08_land_8_20_14_0_20_43_14]